MMICTTKLHLHRKDKRFLSLFLYTPYGSIDTIETVVQVIRLSVKVLSGIEKQNPIISWKGNPDGFLKEGFELSDRFKQSTEMLETNRNSYINDNCEVCSKND